MKRSAAAQAALMAALVAATAGILGVTVTSSSPNFQEVREGRAETRIQVGHVTPRWHVPDAFRGADTWMRLRSTRRRRNGPGWTNAHQKRVATKARNVKRHRASQKG